MSEKKNMSDVKRTERGWAGHFIGSNNCRFRRNTLLEYKDRKWIVSTIGGYILPSGGKPTTIGVNRWFETMIFEAVLRDGYLDADVTKQIYPDHTWGIWGESWEQVIKEHPAVDETANEMHEVIVEEMMTRIKEDNNGR